MDCADAIWKSPTPAEAETPWRERPLPWPRARSQTRSDLVVAHATINLAGAVMTEAMASGRQHTPTACVDEKPPTHIWLAAADGDGVKAGRLEIRSARVISREGNTPRWALFPFLFPREVLSRQVALARRGRAHVAVGDLRRDMSKPVTTSGAHEPPTLSTPRRAQSANGSPERRAAPCRSGDRRRGGNGLGSIAAIEAYVPSRPCIRPRTAVDTQTRH